MVLVKAAGVNGGAWTPFNIGRNWQGSITHVATADGTLVEEFAYSPWGEESTPDALDTLSVGDVVDFGDMEPVDGSLILPEYPGEGETELNLPEPLNSRLGLSLYVGAHGYTGHEHLWQYGLINCNARIYDPSVGRFLSPDPLIQDPASTQNFNRYSYCLNNPLKYTDESGEFLTWNFGYNGFSIGLNFTPIGIPLGFGFNFNFGEGLGVYGEVGFRVGGTGFGTGAAVQYSANYNFRYKEWNKSTTGLVYASLGAINAGGSYTWSKVGSGWNASVGVGFGNYESGLGINIGYGSNGWSWGIGGYYSFKPYGSFMIGSVDDLSDKPLPASDNVLMEKLKKWYLYAPMDAIKVFTVDNVPATIALELEANAGEMAETRPYYLKGTGKLTGKSAVYFSKRAFSSEYQLFITIGHELVHVSHYQLAAALGFTISKVRSAAFIEMTEYFAYSFQSKYTNSPLNSFNSKLFIEEFGPEVVSQFHYINMPWVQSINNWL